MTETPTPHRPTTHPLERALAVLAAAACLFITVAIWRSVSPNQAMWPLPALYFIEMGLVGVIAAAAFIIGHPRSARLAWIAAGIYSAFSFMGLFSVGLLYVPIALLFLLLAVLATSRRELRFTEKLVPFVAAALAQAALMFLVIRLMYPGQ